MGRTICQASVGNGLGIGLHFPHAYNYLVVTQVVDNMYWEQTFQFNFFVFIVRDRRIGRI